MKLSTILGTIGTVIGAVQAQDVPDKSSSLPAQFNGPVNDFDYDGATVFSDNKVTLTPLDKGNQHGALWSKYKNPFNEWTFEISVSVSGPSSPGGGLALWYAGNPNQAGPVHGSRDYWDGLGLFLDSESGEGTLRGHLNDGSIGYKNFKNPTEKAFSLCKINYRNTGAEFSLRIGYGQGSVVVDVNGQKCFETDAVALPKDLFFGVSAASSANPDSFVIHKFNVYPRLIDALSIHRPGAKQQPQQQQQQLPPQQQQQQPIQQQPRDSNNAAQLDAVLQKLDQTNQRLDRVDGSIKGLGNVQQQLSGLESRIDRIEGMFKDVNNKLGTDPHKQHLTQEMQSLRHQLDQISHTVSEHTSSLLGTLPETVNQAITNGGPSIWIVFVLFIVVQGVLIVAYNIYKTRRSYHAKIL